jgi:mRNA-degrading endonuclease toxin of MazEF toxin-antitoxin module
MIASVTVVPSITVNQKRRLSNKSGNLTQEDMRKIEHAVKVQLGLLR